MKKETPVLEPLPTTLWLVHYPGNRPYLGTLYEDREVALHARRSFEVVIEIQLVDDAPTFSDRMTDLIRRDHVAEGKAILDRQCGPEDHLYVAKAGSAIGEGVCLKCGAKEQPDNG